MSDQTLEACLTLRPLYEGSPDALLPAWPLATCRGVRRDLLAGTSPAGSRLE